MTNSDLTSEIKISMGEINKQRLEEIIESIAVYVNNEPSLVDKNE